VVQFKLGLTALAITALAVAAGATACSSADTADGSAGEATRTVETVRGSIDVPDNPLRVVTLEPVELDTTVALGIVPVGTAVLSETAGVPAYLGTEAADIATVGTVAEPTIEDIATAQPDLILGTETRHAQYYDQLSAIAPTVFIASQSDPWRDSVRFVGRVLGKEAKAEELLTAYDDRCAEIAEKHDTAGKTAQLIRPRSGESGAFERASGERRRPVRRIHHPAAAGMGRRDLGRPLARARGSGGRGPDRRHRRQPVGPRRNPVVDHRQRCDTAQSACGGPVLLDHRRRAHGRANCARRHRPNSVG
jgi:hypothetical protein